MKKRKDPAVLLYIDKFLVSTAEMAPDELGWYTRALLHNYDKGDLPSSLDDLAGLLNVKPSEWQRFQLVMSKLVKDKFIIGENSRMQNPTTSEVMRSRKKFTEKKSFNAKWGYWTNYLRKNFVITEDQISQIKSEITPAQFADMDKEEVTLLLQQKCEQKCILYVNTNKNINTIIDSNLSTVTESIESADRGGVRGGDFPPAAVPAKIPLGHQMQNIFQEINPQYPKIKKLDDKAIEEWSNMIAETEKIPRKFPGFTDQDKVKIIEIWKKIAVWYKNSNQSKGLNELKFKSQQIIPEVKKVKHANQKHNSNSGRRVQFDKA